LRWAKPTSRWRTPRSCSGDDIAAAHHADQAVRVQTGVGYADGLAQAKLCRAWTARAVGQLEPALADVHDAARRFADANVYPTLHLICRRIAGLLGETTTDGAVPAQWLIGTSPTERRILQLVGLLESATQ
jgi:hypothetical protein